MKMKSILLPWDVDLLPQKKLLAGQLTCMYEAGNLRSIKCGGTEILRMIYSALRNENWDTIPFNIVDEKIEEKENGFFISYSGIYQQDHISYKAFFEIEGRADNSITFLMKGEALSSFKKNRIGNMKAVKCPLQQTIVSDSATCIVVDKFSLPPGSTYIIFGTGSVQGWIFFITI